MKSINRFARIAGSFIIGYILSRSLIDFYQDAPGAGSWLGKFSLKWGLAFAGFALFCVLLLAAACVAIWFPEKVEQAQQRFATWRERLGKSRWILAFVMALFPSWFILYTDWGKPFTGSYLRLLLWLFASLLLAICITSDKIKLAHTNLILLSLVLVSSLYAIAYYLTNVTNYPFALSWSEGNRFYDYSVTVDSGRYIYPGNLTIPYSSAGRYWLWGILFLIPHLPIWLHRLWDAILWTAPYIILGYVTARKCNLNGLAKWIFAFWVFLFLTQGPIYPPLVLSAILIFVFVQPGNLILSLIGVSLAGYYASSSRWTWLPASSAWAVLILLSNFKTVSRTVPEAGESWMKLLRRLAPIAVIALLGLVAGVLASPSLQNPQKITGGIALSQPLLWYRLFPSATFPEGILLGLIIATLPLIVWLVWLVASKGWILNWLLILAIAGACLGTLSIGLVASVKIGGGNNLHNLDMFLITLVILSGLALRQVDIGLLGKWPTWVQGLLVLILCLPGWGIIRKGVPLELPPKQVIVQSLEELQKRASKVQRRGEVLFIDQRQLLTFGYIQSINLVPDYEKKYMMDQAMAGNAGYFEAFYRDLANRRFELIVTEPLFANIQDPSYSFQEENNAWVHWVAEPLLCYYAPQETLSDVRIQMLVPRENPVNCP